MRAWMVGGAALALLGGAAAAEPQTAGDKPVVQLCERGDYAERMLKREHGAAPFATAAEVLAVVNGGGSARAQGWSTPRCMTGLEYARLDAALRRAADQRRLRGEARRVLAAR